MKVFFYINLTSTITYNTGRIKSLDNDQIDKLTIDPNSNFSVLEKLLTSSNFTIKVD